MTYAPERASHRTEPPSADTNSNSAHQPVHASALQAYADSEAGDWHAAAHRSLFNRMTGQLYHCLQHCKLFDEHMAFPSELVAAA